VSARLRERVAAGDAEAADQLLRAAGRDEARATEAEAALSAGEGWQAAVAVLPRALGYAHEARRALYRAVAVGAAARGVRRRARRVEPPFHVVLVEPEIPQNTGSVARTCAATGAALELVEPLGFSIEDRWVKRAGLDYWPHVAVRVHASLAALRATAGPEARFFYYSGMAPRAHVEAEHRPGDWLVFGSETRGLPWALLAAEADRAFCIPMARADVVRSLNLASAATLVLYEALRQVGGCALDADAAAPAPPPPDSAP
jgi:tRNA (cytidine/uridine-2'-O-)-methyltransferase